MKIEIIPKRADAAGQELLELSRLLRRAREDVEKTRQQLRRHSQLEECRRQLQRQEEALTLSTAGAVDMCCALKEITDLYRTAEERNAEGLEEQASVRRIQGYVAVFGAGDGVDSRIRNILKR